jgi:hypothetical protein
MTDIGELTVKIKADASQLQSELSKASSSVKQSSSAMSNALMGVKETLGVLGVALSAEAFIEFAKGALNAADNLYIMGQRIGFASSTLSALNIPLKQNGSSVDEFSSSMKFMNRNVELASEGNKELLARFDALHISVTKLKSLTPEQQFFTLADALSKVADQGKFTADGMAIFGRGFASIAPLIKEADGKLADFVETQKKMGNALTDDEIKKVHEFEDAWISMVEHVKIKTVDALAAVYDWWNATVLIQSKTDPSKYGFRVANNGELYGPPAPPKPKAPSAAGNNDDITSGDQKAVTNELKDYIDNLKAEADALTLSKDALILYKAEKEGADKALKDFNNHLRESPDLNAAERQAIDEATTSLEKQKKAHEDLQRAQEQQAQMAAQMDAQVASSLADIVVNYKGAGNAISGILDQIAKKILQDKITAPLVNGLSTWLSGGTPTQSARPSPNFVGPMPASSGVLGGIKNMLGFASGGSPPVGVPSMVGENGPELFVPNQSGTIIPNNKLGGGTMMVTNVFNISTGVTQTVRAEIMNLMPAIQNRTTAAVAGAVQQGGAFAKVMGVRN